MNLQILTILAMFLGGAEAADPPPGGIKLLEGYQHEKLQGIDTRYALPQLAPGARSEVSAAPGEVSTEPHAHGPKE